MKRIKFVLFVAVLVGFAAPASADTVYTWTDANGMKHVSDTPAPEGANSIQELHHSDRKPPTPAELREEARRDQERSMEVDRYFREKEMEREEYEARTQMEEGRRRLQMENENTRNEQAKAALERHIELEKNRLRSTNPQSKSSALHNLEATHKLERDPEKYFYNQEQKREEQKSKEPPRRPTVQGAVDPRTGTYYAPAGKGLVNTRDGTYLTPAGPNGYIDTRTGEFDPSSEGVIHPVH
jgi:hypothetical protein